MRKTKVFSAVINGVFTQVKAYKKVNAVARFQLLDSSIKSNNVRVVNVQNFHQSSVEEDYPEICRD